MMSDMDWERITKATQAADLLAQDLKELAKADNAVLADVAIELMKQATAIEDRLKRIESLAGK
jgi:hypothetical protein